MESKALRALTAAALALPGLANAQDDAAVLQFGRYQETSRDLFGLSSKFAPLRSDSLQASAWSAFADRLNATFNFHQDTWSGATPIATAPREWRGNRSRALDSVSGASPYVVVTSPLYLDKATHKPLRTDGFGNLTGGTDTQLVHTIAGASRETRKQADVNVRRSYDDSAYNVNGGVSSEPDYLSRFAGVGGQWDFNQKLTTLNAGLAYTWSDIKATLDHDATPYIYNACGTARCNFVSSSSHIADTDGGGKVMVRHAPRLVGDRRHHAGPVAQLAAAGEPRLHRQPGIPFQSVQARRGRVHRPRAAVPVALARCAVRQRRCHLRETARPSQAVARQPALRAIR